MAFPSLPNGGIFGALSGMLNPAQTSAPTVPNDGAMQPTIGPGAAPVPSAPAAPYTPKLGLPQGGILGMLQGKSPQGIMGLLQHLMGPQQGAPAAPGLQGAGMLSGLPGTPGASAEGPVAPQMPQLPMNISPADQI